MKTVALCLWLFVVSSCMNNDEKSEFDQLWAALITASSERTEEQAVDKLRQYIRSNEGSFVVYGVDKTGVKYDVQNEMINQRSVNIVSYELAVDWEEDKSSGKGWRPKEVDNVYRFFLE